MRTTVYSFMGVVEAVTAAEAARSGAARTTGAARGRRSARSCGRSRAAAAVGACTHISVTRAVKDAWQEGQA
jgi:hypothetical protein